MEVEEVISLYKEMSREAMDSYFDIAGEVVEVKNRFRPGVYDKYNVKRGLRNEDGSGVLVGLTEIGDVHAYVFDEGEKVPVEGRLVYRGVDIYDLVKGFISEKRFGFEECAYLLLFGDLPNAKALNQFNEVLGSRRKIDEDFVRANILNAPSPDVMNKIARLVLTMYSFDKDADDTSIKNLRRQSMDLIAKLPVMAV